MAKKMLSTYNLFVENVENLASVTAATNGDSIDTKWYRHTTTFIEVSGNTGAVTVKVQGSYDGTKWFDLWDHTYTATNSDDIFATVNHYPFMRTITETQSNSTVKTTVTGRS